MPDRSAAGPPQPALCGLRSRLRTWWRWLPCPVLAVSLALRFAAGDGSSPRSVLMIISAFVVLELVGIGFCLRAVTHPRLDIEARRPWRYVLTSCVLLLLSGVVSGAAVAAGGDAGGMGKMSDPLILFMAGRALAVPPLLVGMMSFREDRLSTRRRWRLVLDAMAASGAGLMVLWYCLLGPALDQDAAMVGVNRLGTVVLPVGDLLLIFGIAAVLLRFGMTRGPLRLLLASTATTLLGDLVLAYQVVHVDGGQLQAATALDSLLLLPSFLIALAAAEQCWRAGCPGPADHVVRGRDVPAWLPYIALAVGSLVLVLAASGSGLNPWGGLVLGTLLMVASIAARQLIVIRENQELVLTDSLTGLPNRVRIRDELRRVLDRARLSGDQAGVLLIDLDDFQEFNDTHGPEVGDAVLVAFAEVLRSSLRHGDTPARLGGDEFAVVLEGISSADTAITVAERVLAHAAMPRMVGGVRVRLRASIGIAVTGGGGEPETCDPRDLLHRADQAMRAAKRRGTHSWQLHDQSVELEREQRARDELLDALHHGQLRVHYQPIVSLVTGGLVAVEALVRWQHPIRGLLSPAQFLPTAERLGIIQDLDSWVLEQACWEILGLDPEGGAGRGLRLSVNLAPQHLQRPDVADRVLETLTRTGFDPRLLVLEVTEGMALQEEEVIRSLQLLRGYGVQIALDDFGTGYSSIGKLGQLPIDILKLDRCFVTELQTDPAASVVVQTVLRLSQLLQLETVAEGIAGPSQAEQFAQVGFSTAQGYHFARPMDVAALRRLLDEGMSFPVDADPVGSDPVAPDLRAPR